MKFAWGRPYNSGLYYGWIDGGIMLKYSFTTIGMKNEYFCLRSPESILILVTNNRHRDKVCDTVMDLLMAGF